MTKLQQTSETTIALIMLVMNLDKILRDLLLPFIKWLMSIAADRSKCAVLKAA